MLSLSLVLTPNFLEGFYIMYLKVFTDKQGSFRIERLLSKIFHSPVESDNASYLAWCKEGNQPQEVPYSPYRIYGHELNLEEKTQGKFSTRKANGYWYLFEDGVRPPWMVNHPAEVSTMIDAVIGLEGRVLVGGLGLGITVEKLAAKPEVTEIVVVEIEQDIIDLIWPHLKTQGKATIIKDNINNYLKNAIDQFDGAFFDTWLQPNEEAWEKVAKPMKDLAISKGIPEDKIYLWAEKLMNP